MLKLLLIPIIGLAPGIFWLWLIYQRDKYRPEPKALVIRTFLMGMVAVVPVALVEAILLLPYILPDAENFTMESLASSLGNIAYFSFVVAGVTEELFKFLAVRFTVYRSPYFNEPMDGLIYASAAALGFASLENVSYLFSLGLSWDLVLGRALISTLAHVSFSVMWGYPLALHKLKKPRAVLLLWLGVIGAMAGHGLFDFLAMVQDASADLNIFWLTGLIAVFVGMLVLFLFLLRRARRVSPFKDSSAELLVSCPACQAHILNYAVLCPNCGSKLEKGQTNGPVFCGKCGNEINHSTSYCPACGSRIVRGRTHR
ncbi:MAG: PrsW family intramembrane metalloprotease [Dehalococcoidales bacterium]|nr:PrsW family intramembrane metalloprotease [Dehalococcoidales bacterium]